MPRLPTMRVIGSHAISTSWPGSRAACEGSGMIVVIRMLLSPQLPARRRLRESGPHLPGASRSGFEFRARVPPVRLLVDRSTGDVPQAADDRSVHARSRGGPLAPRWLVHERHELVREAWHRAADADAADVRAAADSVDPSPLGDVALDDWA